MADATVANAHINRAKAAENSQKEHSIFMAASIAVEFFFRVPYNNMNGKFRGNTIDIIPINLFLFEFTLSNCVSHTYLFVAYGGIHAIWMDVNWYFGATKVLHFQKESMQRSQTNWLQNTDEW